jgi:hypothetical protein
MPPDHTTLVTYTKLVWSGRCLDRWHDACTQSPPTHGVTGCLKGEGNYPLLT